MRSAGLTIDTSAETDARDVKVDRISLGTYAVRRVPPQPNGGPSDVRPEHDVDRVIGALAEAAGSLAL